uniref:sensor histidine kinase n=1 Tax=Flavobacterium sp. TaxID=239 RepID=UPI004047C03C
DFVRYASLPAGNYTFTVRAVNANGLFSENKTILIEVNAPFWQKWWFYIVLIVGVGAASWMYFKIRFARLEKEKQIAIEKAEMDKELVFSQLENLRSQMNPHFIFNALNSIQEYIVSNEKETASAFLVKFSRLIRIYLEHSRMSEVQLDDELKALHLYLELEKDRFEDTLNYSIHVSSEIDVKAIKIPSLFLQPYIENALKHGLLHKKRE